jgi:hypothetical protein
VVQFYVGDILFDRFFNARLGYRAHFRHHYKCGLRFNNKIVAALRSVLDHELPELIDGRLLGHPPEDRGALTIEKRDLLESFERYVSKIWWCRDRFKPDAGVEKLPFGLDGPRLALDEYVTWAAPFRSDAESWLELKGRFVGKPRFDQHKKYIATRAISLSKNGTA